MKRLLRALRSPVVKWLFLAVALGFALWFVLNNRAEIGEALAGMPAWTLLASLLAGSAYVALTLLAWRRALADVGHPLRLAPAVALFGVSQLGKYIPGGVWNIAAAADLGRAHRIPARHSVASMTVALLVSLVSGVAIAAAGLLAVPTPAIRDWVWVLWAGIPLLVALAPPVMNRLLALLWRMLRRDPGDVRYSNRGVGGAIVWSLLAWLVAGVSVAFLAIGLGAPQTVSTFVQCIAGYALAWVAGFLVVVAPAGAGIREVVLAAALTGILPPATVVTLALLSRVVLTLVDFGFAGAGAAITRRTLRRTRG